MESIGPLRQAYRAAQHGNLPRMLGELSEYYEQKQMPKSEKLKARLYEVLELNLRHNIRRDLSLGLGDENTRCNAIDLTKVISEIQELMKIEEEQHKSSVLYRTKFSAIQGSC